MTTETRPRVLHWFVAGGVARTPEGRELVIDVDPLVIGRDAGATLVVADPEVSAFHCELRAVSEGILVRDLGSTHGTFLGPVRVHEAIVTTSSELMVGRSRIVIEPLRKQVTLESLLSQVTPDNLHGEVDFGSSVGREIL